MESWQESQQKTELLALSCSKPAYSFGKVNASFRFIALGLLLKDVRVVRTGRLRVNNAGIAIRTHCCWRISHRRIAFSWPMDKQKEGKAKFGNKPLGKLDVDQEEKEPQEQERDFAPAPEDDFEIIRKDRKEPDFGMESSFDNKFASDPLIDDVLDVKRKSIKKNLRSCFCCN